MKNPGFASTCRHAKRLLFFFRLCLILTLLPCMGASAADTANITSCRLITAKKIRVTVSVPDPLAINGDTCYLFALPLSSSNSVNKSKPVSSAAKAAALSFTVPLNSSRSSSLLYSRFVIAQKNEKGLFVPISNASYISNPQAAARYKYSFPTAVSKKGLQVNADMLEDAAELNVHHSALNIVFSDLIATRKEQKSSLSIAYKYQGKTYWFRKSAVNSYDRQLTALKRTNTTVSAILLLGWRNDLKQLIYPAGRKSGHSFYAWNTKTDSARKQLQATISFLASRYSTAAAKNGRIVNWIVGNEVNNYGVYNYAGEQPLATYAQIYADAFRLTYNTVTSVYANARVYISLDHLWNIAPLAGSFPSRQMLDAFALALNSQGGIPWNLAYHPYSSPLTEPKFWENANRQLTEEVLSTPVINMGNISLLSSYIRQKYGAGTRIILSEQGYTSVQAGKNAEKEQSAAIAYSYYLTEADDMIDSFIMNRHVDHRVEIAQGLNLGLWTTRNGAIESAGRKKASWNVFKYMDTTQSETVTSSFPGLIGADSWASLIQNFGASLYAKTPVMFSQLRQVSSYRKRASISSKWSAYGAAGKRSKSKQTITVTHDSGRNGNVVWGFSQNFKKGLSFASNPVFYTTLKISGAKGKKAAVKIRFFSGNSILESEGVIRAGSPVRLGVSLANWEYRNKVTGIQVLVSSVNGSWKKKASVEMTLPVRGR